MSNSCSLISVTVATFIAHRAAMWRTCFAFVSFSVIGGGAYLWVRAIWYVNSEMSLLTGRVTVNDNNGGTRVPLSDTLIQQPPWFDCAELSSVSPLLSHVFCYVDVVTREHPRVGKHSNMGLITSDHCSVLGISLASHEVLLFTVGDVSDPTISTVFHLRP